MKEVGFGTLNWVAVIIYLLAMLLIGVYFTKRASQSTNSFFTASGRLPSWVVGFSIYATTLSAITFMSTPEKAFLTDWSYIAGNIAIVAIIPLLIYFYVPFFKKLKVTSAYEYLEARFYQHTCHWLIIICRLPFRACCNRYLLTNISNHICIRHEPLYRCITRWFTMYFIYIFRWIRRCGLE